MRRVSLARIAPVAIWAIIGFVAWSFAAQSYERFLGSIAWQYFPKEEVFLTLNEDHVFAIGLKSAVETVIPQLTLESHNFGFGLVVTGSVILGTSGRSLVIRLIGLCCAWLLLLLTQAGLLVAAAHFYLSATTQSDISMAGSLFLKSVHPTVTILPVFLVVLWLVIPFEIHRPHSPPRRVRRRRMRRP